MSMLPVGIGGRRRGYEIEKSLRFRGAASSYLSRTPASTGNRKTWTWSGWVKRGALGTEQTILGSADTLSANYNIFILGFTASNTIRVVQSNNSGSATILFDTTDVFRDTSAHYHVQLAIDTPQATGVAGVKLYVNGVLQTGTFTAYTQNYDTSINSSSFTMYIGRRSVINPTGYFDGYMSEVNFIDGQALTPNDFGKPDPVTGQWIPKAYIGLYGNNGFYLPFTDGTSLTTLGYDGSGNNNDWTLNNISLTAGVTYDWMDDTPSNNFCVLNPLDSTTSGAVSVLGSANLFRQSTGTAVANDLASFSISSGKWYWEVVVILGNGTIFAASVFTNGGFFGINAAGTLTAGTTGSTFTYTNNDVLGCAFDYAAKTLAVYKNGAFQSTLSFAPSVAYAKPTIGDGTAASATISAHVNFGQRPFAYTPPTGFKALCTKNLTFIDVIESGSFTGNASANGPFVWCNGTPETLTINGNAVTWGTHADRLANGFKLRTSSSSYNTAGTNNWTATVLSPEFKSAFKNQRAKGNP